MDILVNTLKSVLKTLSIIDILDIVLVAILIYYLMKFIKDTRVAQILKGIVILALSYFVAKQIGLRTIGFVLETLFDIGIVMLVVVFQPELRRMLEHIGQTRGSPIKIFNKKDDYITLKNKMWFKAINNLCGAVMNLSQSNTGALVVLEKNIRLQDIVRTGTILNADPSVELIENLFFKNSPLHDGGVVFRDGKVFAAGCLLPLSQNLKISKELGTRHRAALGMSEISDAAVVVVSEETGTISLAQGGHLIRNVTIKGLKNRLENELILKTNSSTNSDA